MAALRKISLVILLLALSVTLKMGKAEKLKKFDLGKFQLSDRSSTSEIFANFENALNYLFGHSDFKPSVICIGYYVERIDIMDLISRYVRERQLVRYEFDLENLKENWRGLLKGLTWIIIVDDLETLETKIRESPDLWKPVNNFIVLPTVGNVEESTDNLIGIFRTLWNQRRVYKIAIISLTKNFRRIYRYSPFVKVNDEFGSVEWFDLESKNLIPSVGKNENVDRQRERSNFFEDFRDLNGYTINVTIFPSLMMNVTRNKQNVTTYTEFDAEVMKLVEKRLRSKFNVKVFAVNHQVDIFAAALNTVQGVDKADFVFTAYFIKNYLSKFQFTVSLLEDKVCLIAPASKSMPKYLMPLLPFTGDLWLVLFVYNFCAALLWICIKKIETWILTNVSPSKNVPFELAIELRTEAISRRTSKKRLGFEDSSLTTRRKSVNSGKLKYCRSNLIKTYDEPSPINDWFVRCFDLFLLVCLPLQGGKTCVERAFLSSTLVFGLVVIGLYQSYLVSSLSKPISYPELNTLADVVASNRTIFTKFQNLVADFRNDDSPEMKILRNRTEILQTNERTYDIVAYKGMIAIGRSASFLLENLTQYQSIDDTKMLLHLVQECPASYSLAYVARLHSPYLEKVDDLLLRMDQAGLIKKWYDDMLLKVKIAWSQAEAKRIKRRVKLTLEHLLLAFLGLCIGLCCCTIVFFSEIQFSKKHYSFTIRSIVPRLPTRDK